MKQLHIPVAAVMAAAITLGLFLLMHSLISSGSGKLVQLEAIAGIHFGPIDIPQEITTRSRRKPKKPPPPKEPPPPPRMQILRQEPQLTNMPRMEVPDLRSPLVSGEGVFPGTYLPADRAAEGDIMPIVVIRPMYPREAALSGTQGWVKVEFTITEAGTVKNPRVIEAEPARIFNREAIRAILNWKFKPRIIDGIAVERKATQTIEFTLDDAKSP